MLSPCPAQDCYRVGIFTIRIEVFEGGHTAAVIFLERMFCEAHLRDVLAAIAAGCLSPLADRIGITPELADWITESRAVIRTTYFRAAELN